MGFHRLPSIRHYWRDDKNFAVPRISSIMALNRFLQILKSLRFATRSTDKKSLIDPLVGHINETFCQLRSPKGWLTLDESELQSRTANYFSEKRRITISSLCCSKSGYLFKMSPQYPSLSMNEVAEVMLATYENSGQSIVLGKRHSNFVLAERLFEKKLFVCTRLSVHDPNISKLFPSREQTSEEGDFRQSGNFSVTKWKNRKQYLYILSTRHDPSATKSVLRSNDKNSKELVNCRETVLDYNNYKSGVELFYHLTHAYSTSWRSSDWTRRFFFFFLDAALVNSYILFTEAWQLLKSDEGTEKKLNPLDFRSRIADQLIGSFMTRKRPASTSAPLVKRLKRGLTFYIDESTMHLPTKCTSRRCVHCSSTKEPRRSTTMCSDCQVVLCLDCYTPFHTNSTHLSIPNLHPGHQNVIADGSSPSRRKMWQGQAKKGSAEAAQGAEWFYTKVTYEKVTKNCMRHIIGTVPIRTNTSHPLPYVAARSCNVGRDGRILCIGPQPLKQDLLKISPPTALAHRKHTKKRERTTKRLGKESPYIVKKESLQVNLSQAQFSRPRTLKSVFWPEKKFEKRLRIVGAMAIFVHDHGHIDRRTLAQELILTGRYETNN
ncbi:unnamed protein product, partial [Nesidiocoris tenuis]